MQWSPYQQAIFREVADGTGHVVVNACPGSGKTTTILGSLSHVPYGKTSLFCAFNKDIALTLKEKVRETGAIGVEVSTLHSYGLRQTTRALGKLKVEPRRADHIITSRVGDDHNFDLRRDLAKAVEWAKGSLLSRPDQIVDLVSSLGLHSAGPFREELRAELVEQEREDEEIEAILAATYTCERFVEDVLWTLEKCKDTSDGMLDFNDMVWLPVVLDLKCWQFDFVFVDETQDLNPAQIELVLKAVKPAVGRIVAVGDPRQAIYGFRGAAEGAFEKVRDTLGARELPLSVCYRCGSSIVALAKEVEEKIETPVGAPEGYVSDGDDATVDAMMRDASPGDFILSRTNAPLLSLCFKFLRAGRRAHIQGRDIGANMISWIKKTNAKTVDELRGCIESWCEAEVKRLRDKKKSLAQTEAVADRAECLMELSDGARTIQQIVDAIERLFADSNDHDRIVLSTTHKAKGLERERVWLLADTYRKRDETEEHNLWYVAVTRAKSDLRLVYGLGGRKKRSTEEE